MTVQKVRAASDDLLVELGCEELPPKALDGIREAFFVAVRDGLEKNALAFDAEGSRSYSTPRRIALLFRQVSRTQPDQQQERRGPAVQAAFDEQNQPTRAAEGFARSVGKTVEELERVRTDKGEWLYAKIHQQGKPLADLVYPILEQAVHQLPIPRPMRWADHDFSFVRPVHWLLVLHGDRVLEGALFGQQAGNTTHGHRIHAPGPHRVAHARDYRDTLRRAFVVTDQDERKQRILEALRARDAHVRIEADLLAEVNNLVEWPVVIECSFEESFLELPHAVLIASMQAHQKFFPIANPSHPGEVSHRFLVVCNLESTDVEAVREGFERVIRPRLADARFFLEQDLKQGLEACLPQLDEVIFQEKIGSIGEKTRRITAISETIADDLSVDSKSCSRAAQLSKCDLLSLMVGEFPELQGTMGRHYALAAGEPEAVAKAIEEHYLPRYAGDRIPATICGQIVSIADRLDTLAGVFAAGLRPSGNKDPFALRRSALGLLRILLEGDLELELNRLLAIAANELAGRLPVEPEVLVEIRDFCSERLRSHFREQGLAAELINAALASDWDTVPDLNRRLCALADFMGDEAASALAGANKRIGNILHKANQDISTEIATDRFILAPEKVLFDEITRLEAAVEPLLENGDYADALARLAALRGPVDGFFDAVMVMDDDPALRTNRLALLSRLKSLFDRIADLSVLG
ncbi:MAG: glycine--tRNA ligase subunit beta [Xanthomonadales bacterium]|nr:glycine--tRNA ligase subunit beta [Xanthomonadales bacterium]